MNEKKDNVQIQNELNKKIAKQLLELRRANNYTQDELASISNVPRETIARIERTIVSPQVSTLIRIISVLGYTVKIVPIDEKK